jgi:hypothetical protein
VHWSRLLKSSSNFPQQLSALPHGGSRGLKGDTQGLKDASLHALLARDLELIAQMVHKYEFSQVAA